MEKFISNLSKKELYDLLFAYDKYVIEIVDREDGSIPVCVSEFFDNEYQEERNVCCLP